MNSNIKHRIFGASAVIAVLFGAVACGTETVNEPGTQPGFEARVYPPTSVPSTSDGRKGGISADAAERKAAADKARRDKASTDRWARGTQVENKLDQAGHPGRP